MNSPEPPPLPNRFAGEPADPGPPPVCGAPISGIRPPRPAPVATPHLPEDAASGDAAAADDRLRTFLEQARWILSDQRGMTVKAELMLAAVARELGLDEAQTARAIGSLRPEIASQPPPAPPVVPIAPPPEVASPELLFRAYVGEALAKASRDVVSQRREKRLVQEGVHKLGLSQVFARQIVAETAAAMGKRLAQPAKPGAAATGAAVEDSASDPTPAEVTPEMAEFLERAAAILAEQRGINTRSRILLSTVGQRLGLTTQQTDQALQLLQKGSGTSEAWQSEREEAFCADLRTRLNRATKVLTGRAEQQRVEAGQQLFGLTASRAARLVRQTAQELSVRVVSEDRARSHVYELAGDLLEQGARLDRSTRARIQAEGSQWGLVPEQVQEILQDLLHDQQRTSTAKRRGMVGVAVGGAASVLCLLAVLAAFSYSPDERGDQAVPGEAGTPASPVVLRTETPQADSWWARDEELLLVATKLRIILPDLKTPLLALNEADEDRRSAAYRQLVRQAMQHADMRMHAALLREFFAGCLTVDPSEACAEALVEALLGLVPRVGESLSGEESAGEIPFWAVRTVLAAIGRKPSPPRADLLGQALGRMLGVTIDAGGEARELDRQCVRALSQHLYDVLIAAAPSQPAAAPQAFVAVTGQARRYLEPQEIEQRTLELLASALPLAADSWREYEYLLQLVINSADPLSVLRVVDLFERIEEPQLQDFLASRLLRRAGIYSDSFAPIEVAQRVRAALGAKDPVSGRQRWRLLDELVEELAAAEDQAPPAERLQEVAELAHAGTLACALAQGDVGHAAFDELHAAGSAQLAATDLPPSAAAPASQPQRRVPSSILQSILSNIQQLSSPREGQRSYAPIYLRNLALTASLLPELPREPAERLGRYLLSSKDAQEHQTVLQHTEALTRWTSVRLAMLDQLADTHGKREHVIEVVSRAVCRDLNPAADSDWRQSLRDALLSGLIGDLESAAPREGNAQRVYDDLREALRELYIAQARVLGVPAELYASGKTPAEVLQQIVEASAAKAPPGSRQQSGQSWADSREQLAAIDYAVGSDLERTVLLQRLRLQLLATQLAHEGKIAAGQADPLLVTLQESDRRAVDLISQLRDAERFHLQLWLLTRPVQ